MIFHVVLPLLVGSVIYLLFRPTSLLMFRWAKHFGIFDYVIKMRAVIFKYNAYLPKWFIFSLPNALWVYSLTAYMLLLWYGHSGKMKYFWISLGLLFSAGMEILQYFYILPGTFDLKDLVFVIAGFALPILLNKKILLRRLHHV